MVIWDILENFMYTLSKYHEMVQSLPNKEEVDEDVFNLERSRKLLDKLVAFIPAEPSKTPTSK